MELTEAQEKALQKAATISKLWMDNSPDEKAGVLMSLETLGLLERRGSLGFEITDAGRKWLEPMPARERRYFVQMGTVVDPSPELVTFEKAAAIATAALQKNPLETVAVWGQPVVWARAGRVNTPSAALPDEAAVFALGVRMSAIIEAATEAREAGSDD